MHPAWPLQIPHGILLASETYLKHDCLDKSESNLSQVSAYCSNAGAGEGKEREIKLGDYSMFNKKCYHLCRC